MPKIPKGVKTNDNMVGGFDIIKYYDHDVFDAIKFPDLTTHRPVKYIERLDLVFPKIPTKALYKLQVIITQEIQFRGRSDATKL
jgi:hypothetical protein